MSLENLTIPMWCEHWARWSVKNPTGVKGFPSVSLIADKSAFQTERAAHVTPLGERIITAKGTQTKSHRTRDIPDDTFAEVLDQGIAQMGAYLPELQIIVGAEYLGAFPQLLVENWRPEDAQLSKFKRLTSAWRRGVGYRVNFLRRRPHETTDMWRANMAKKLGIGHRTFYDLLSKAHIYLFCWRDTELQDAIEEITAKTAARR